jgi:adenine-specific DNA-methyltransferase
MGCSSTISCNTRKVGRVKVRSEVTKEKLRGGFYSPTSLVAECLQRVEALMPGTAELRVLEPSSGDGAFIRGIAATPFGHRVSFLEAVELMPGEAAGSVDALRQSGISGVVYPESALSWADRQHGSFDVAVGNPPFVRFQFLTDEDKAALPALGTKLDVSFRGVSNLWIPVLLVALSRLREGGAFAFIVPTELFTGISANTVREWLCIKAIDLEVRLFPPASFPGVLQEVIVLSGRRGHASHPTLKLVQMTNRGEAERWQHALDPKASTWTRYLLAPAELDSLMDTSEGRSVVKLGTVAKFEVAAVTGANDFFSVSTDVINEYRLGRWVRPLLPRARLAPGLRYTLGDHRVAAEAGARVGLLDFSAELPNPLDAELPKRYLESGEDAGLHRRYKTRIRNPWYRVPHIRSGRLMLSKRSHRYPRLILNDAGVVTTDTIYRGSMRPEYEGREEDLAAVFHNSLTLLSAEVEGRSFGGGVLELVPSEIGRLVVPFLNGAGAELDQLSDVAIGSDGEITDTLVERTDALLLRHSRLDPEKLDVIRSARFRLQARRLDRAAANGHNGENLE